METRVSRLCWPLRAVWSEDQRRVTWCGRLGLPPNKDPSNSIPNGTYHHRSPVLIAFFRRRTCTSEGQCPEMACTETFPSPRLPTLFLPAYKRGSRVHGLALEVVSLGQEGGLVIAECLWTAGLSVLYFTSATVSGARRLQGRMGDTGRRE